MASFDHDPAATETLSIDWTRDLETGESIITSTWTIDAGVTQVTSGAAAGVTSVTIQGGVDGTTYNAKNTIVTSIGNTWSRTIFIQTQAIA